MLAHLMKSVSTQQERRVGSQPKKRYYKKNMELNITLSEALERASEGLRKKDASLSGAVAKGRENSSEL